MNKCEPAIRVFFEAGIFFRPWVILTRTAVCMINLEMRTGTEKEGGLAK